MATTPGTAVPGTTVPASSLVASGGAQGVQGLQGAQGVLPGQSVQFLSAAYNIQSTDNGKYLICSGGSWTLGLPTPASGLYYRVRNDQGITGTTGTITLAPISGTIDNLATLALLPGQECTILTDGTNWRTHGRQRVVNIGAVDITNAASQTMFLPAGYRLFDIDMYGLTPVTTMIAFQMKMSQDGGNTFLATTYYDGIVYNNSTTGIVYSYAANATIARISPAMRNQASDSGQIHLTINPGSASKASSWIGRATGFDGTNNWITTWAISGAQYTLGLMTAIQIICSSGNIAAGSIVVKGIV